MVEDNRLGQTVRRQQAVENAIRVTLNHADKSRDFYLFNTPLSRHIFEGIVTGKTYPVQPFFGEVRTVVDVGANVGAATVYFALIYPKARILAFEPSPPSYALLARNTEALANVAIFNFGLADKNGQASLYLGAQDSVTNSVQLSPECSAENVTVDLREAGAALAEQAATTIDILKLDTEGCEIPILRSLSDLIPRIGVLFIEYHDEEDRLEIDQLLSATHILCSGRVLCRHRGEFCYVAKSRLIASGDGCGFAK